MHAKDQLPNSCPFPWVTPKPDTHCILESFLFKGLMLASWQEHPDREEREGGSGEEGESEPREGRGLEAEGERRPARHILWKATLAARLYQHVSPTPLYSV